MPGRTAGVVAGVSTAGAVDFMAAGFTQWAASTGADLVASTGVASTGADLAASTGVGSTGIDFTMAGSTKVDFTTTGFSLVDRLDIPGVIIRTTGITITTNRTPHRPGTIAPIRQAITLM
jgi:hypothetical protein